VSFGRTIGTIITWWLWGCRGKRLTEHKFADAMGLGSVHGVALPFLVLLALALS
jgi:hypothetical protein